jgi:CubicO group peptidase (beta-lactamase class C family)
MTLSGLWLRAKKAAIPLRWGVWLKGLLAFGGVMLMGGFLGLWATGFSVGWAGNHLREWSDGRAPQLEAILRRHCVPFMNEGKSIGLTVGLVTPTNATVMAFGRPSLLSSYSMTGDTLFEIGSITKTFTALTLAREVEQGRVRLDQPIQELLPPGVELPEAARGVTLRHLTTHTSGFPRLPFNPAMIVGSLKMLLLGSDPYAGYAETNLLEDLRTIRLESKPGTKLSYSNFGVALLGYLLARNAGTNYENLLKRDVCQPLAMGDTTLTLTRAQAARFAQGYRAVTRLGPVLLCLRASPWFVGSDLGGAGAIRSTGSDMMKYLESNLRPKDQVLEHALRETHRELFRENAETAIGWNWLRTRNQPLKQDVIWHNGGTGGFCSFVGFTEDCQVGVVVLSNTAESVDRLGITLLNELGTQTR